MLRKFSLVFLYCLFGFSVCSIAHELEDGFVERAVEVVVRDEVMRVKYFVGLNENTKNCLWKAWSNSSEDQKALGIEDEFQRVLQNKIQLGLKLKVDGADGVLDKRGTEICPKHHFDFVFVYEFDLPVDQTVEVELEDQNFRNRKSCGRYSLKGVGSTIVSSSNVAPIIIRAKRIEFTGEMQQQARPVKIVATVITPSPARENDLGEM